MEKLAIVHHSVTADLDAGCANIYIYMCVRVSIGDVSILVKRGLKHLHKGRITPKGRLRFTGTNK